MEALCTPALAVGLLGAGANTFCTAFKNHNEMHCVEERFLSGHWEVVISASTKADRRWLIILNYCWITWKMTWTQGVNLFCAGWKSVLRLPACELNLGTVQTGERELDTLRAWKSICSDGNFWKSVLVLGIPLLIYHLLRLSPAQHFTTQAAWM